MPYNTGTLSFTRYRVIGDAPKSIDQELLDRAAAQKFVEHELGVPVENSYGWVGPQHIMDPDFTFENCVFGDFLILGIRQDICRVPGEVKRAYQAMEEKATAAGNPSGFISKLQKREAKDAVNRKIDQELRDGKHRKSKLAHVIWDLAEGIIYAPNGKGSQEIVSEIFERTFDLTLMAITPSHLGSRFMEKQGRRSVFEDLKPTPFLKPEDTGAMWPNYPWVAKGDLQNFIGNEFLMMLLFQSAADGDFHVAGKVVYVSFRESLDIECAWGQTGKDSLKDACPVRMSEALPALRTGKVPRKAGLSLSEGTENYYFTLTGDTFAISGLKLPAVEEAETQREFIEERLMLLRGFSRAFDGLFKAFIEHRASKWDDTAGKIRNWLGGSAPRPVKADSKADKPETTNFSRSEIETILKAGQTTARMLEIRDLVHRIYRDTYVRYFHMLRSMIRKEAGKDGSPLSGALKLMNSEKWAQKAKELPHLILFFVASAVDMISPINSTPPDEGEGKLTVSKGMAKAMKQLAGTSGGVSLSSVSMDGKKTEIFSIDESNRQQVIENCDAVIQGKRKIEVSINDSVASTVVSASTAMADQVRETDKQNVFECPAGRLDVAPRRAGTWCYRWQIKLGDIHETSDWTGIEHQSQEAIQAGCESLRAELRSKKDLDDTGAARKRQLEAELRKVEKRFKTETSAA